MTNKKYWIAFFSQSGREIRDISLSLGRWPDRIITNHTVESYADRVCEELMEYHHRTYFLPNEPRPTRPTVTEYETAITDALTLPVEDILITLHGYLRVVPREICEKYEMYNGHPGDIVAYPILKGFNPQKKACELGIEESGSVIHRVTGEVDGGEIVGRLCVKIYPEDLDKTLCTLHSNSTALWKTFLTPLLK